MLLLISRLVYIRQEFVTQLCETLSALRCSKILGTMLAEPELPTAVKLHCLAIVNRVLSMPDSSPSDILCIVGDVFAGAADGEHFTRIVFDLLKLEDSEITVKCLLMLGLLARIDKRVSSAWSKCDRFRDVISELQRSAENENLTSATNFCKKWINI